MGSQPPPKSSKLTKIYSKSPSTTTPTPTLLSSSAVSTHLAMVELKQRILTSLAKLSDRDTHQIAIDELETLIQTLQNDAVPMLLNCLFDSSSSDPKPFVKKESIRLLANLCGSHPESTGSHLVKIIAHLAKRLRDPDSGVRDACRDVIGCMSGVYVKANAEGEGNGVGVGVVSTFVKPLFEAMGENNKGVQVGAAMCLGRVVDCSQNPPLTAFGKLCPRVCKFLNSPNFFAKSALLPVVVSLSQVGAITPQSLDTLLQSIHDCLASTDWATRKAAAEALTGLALHSGDLVKDGAASTLTVLEACRFDKIKPVRDSVAEALQLWKKLSGKAGDGALDERGSCQDDVSSDKDKQKDKKIEQFNDSSKAAVSDSAGKTKNSIFSDKAAGVLKKKLPALTDKDVNPEFFQKLEKRGADELPVEIVVPRKCVNPSNSNEGEESSTTEVKDRTAKVSTNVPSRQRDFEGYTPDRWVDDEQNGKDMRPRTSGAEDRGSAFTKVDGQSDGSLANGKGNWLSIQRQLLQLERQQTHLMNMLQEFMGGSHDSMVTLENRVRGLERVVEDMAHDLSVSSNRRGGGFRSGYEGSSNRPGRYTGYFDYGGRLPYGDRYSTPEGDSTSMRIRGPPRRSDIQDQWDFHSYGASKTGQPGVRRDMSTTAVDGRSPRSDHESDLVSSRRGWDKASADVRLGEGPSARSVWQASKDEATLAAIRVAGDDNGTARPANRVAVRELDAEALGNDNGPERDPIWTAWSNAMDAVQVNDMDTAYAEVLSIGDDSLLVKLMDRTGPVFDQLSDEVAVEAINAIMPFVVEQHLFDLCLSWVQQLSDMVVEMGPDLFGISMNLKRDLLFSLHDATSAIEIPEDWEGPTPDQLMMQLASAWNIDLQQPGR
ncbi:hypothetical protein RND81_12G227000 [Saponaria officinalis]|uniref:TOG domain-containing protein n=1 Tax=Saponaria officinalis TaxID=3572 RepID=A0AAW1HEB2_SAPOF